jgi:hypothetical protein
MGAETFPTHPLWKMFDSVQSREELYKDAPKGVFTLEHIYGIGVEDEHSRWQHKGIYMSTSSKFDPAYHIVDFRCTNRAPLDFYYSIETANDLHQALESVLLNDEDFGPPSEPWISYLDDMQKISVVRYLIPVLGVNEITSAKLYDDFRGQGKGVLVNYKVEEQFGPGTPDLSLFLPIDKAIEMYAAFELVLTTGQKYGGPTQIGDTFAVPAIRLGADLQAQIDRIDATVEQAKKDGLVSKDFSPTTFYASTDVDPRELSPAYAGKIAGLLEKHLN